MLHNQSDSERDTWARTIAMLVLGLVCYTLPGPVLAELNTPVALHVQGSNTIGAKLGPALAKGLLEQQSLRDVSVANSGVNEQQVTGTPPDGRTLLISLAAHGSGTGFVALQDGSAELAASSRPIKATEQQSLQTFGDMRSRSAEQIIAIDGLAIIVHPDNPLQALNLEQLAALFAGEISDWSQLGGKPGAVNLHARDDNSGTYDTFKELVLGRQGKTLNSAAHRYESSDQLSDAVSRDPLGIGFIGLPYIRANKPLAIADGESLPMLPTRELVATEDYPLSRRLFFYLKPDETNPWARALVNFAQSQQGQAIVAQTGFIAQTVQATQVQTSGEMPQAYRKLAEQAQRLTVNFRFKQGSATLDNKAHYDIARISDYLKGHDKLYRKVVLVGFGDPKPDPGRASLLSKLRAVVVSQALRREGLIPRDVVGFGDELPVAANGADEGRQKNQRVEVWIY